MDRAEAIRKLEQLRDWFDGANPEKVLQMPWTVLADVDRALTVLKFPENYEEGLFEIEHLVLVVEGDTEPVLYGPYETQEERDETAIELRKQYPSARNGIYWMDVTANYGDRSMGHAVGAYSAGFFEEIE